MEKKNTSSSSMCREFRQALASNPAFQSFHRIKQYFHPRESRSVITHSNSPYSPPTHLPKNTAIPILFDYSTPTTMGNGHDVGISETAGKVAAKVEPEPQYHMQRPTKVEVVQQHSEHQGKKSLDINDTFTEYIQRAKCRIRTVSNVGKGQNNSTPDHGNGTTANKIEKENQNDHFSDFIQHAKKRFRTTSNVGNTSYSKRG